jgi:hypothetical protein
LLTKGDVPIIDTPRVHLSGMFIKDYGLRCHGRSAESSNSALRIQQQGRFAD